MRPAVFFPVTTTPLAMRAGLQPFGTDFGNRERDQHFFLLDDEADRYRSAKAAVVDDRFAVIAESDAHRAVHHRALQFIDERLRSEHDVALPTLRDLDDDTPLADRWAAVAAGVQEDIAVIHRGIDDDGETIMLDVRFPSGWRPELLRRASFAAIHEPVPGFVNDVRAARSMVKSMVERGPYVRFVWTISADDHLDHHPLHGRRRSLLEASPSSCWLRIERQTTVPLADVGGSLFLIRTILRPLSSLTADERDVVGEALRVMPAEIAAYKGLAAGRAHVIAMIDAMR